MPDNKGKNKKNATEKQGNKKTPRLKSKRGTIKNKTNRKKSIYQRPGITVYLLLIIMIILIGLILILLGKMFFQREKAYIAGYMQETELYEEKDVHNNYDIRQDTREEDLPAIEPENDAKLRERPIMDESRMRRKHSGEIPPKVAIVIDDCGGNIHLLKELVKLPVNTTPAILPHLKYSRETYNTLLEHGIMPILHQPMEAVSRNNNSPDPGEGAVYVGMSKEEIYKTLDNNINSMGFFIGANNHMGSLATSDYNTMLHVMNYFREKGMFFLDSRTTPHTAVPEAASRINLPFLERDIFLDNEKKLDLIIENLRALVDIAYDKGYAIGIGHLHKTMIDAIRIFSKEAETQGYEIDFVFIQDILSDVYGFGDII